jgi:uncharacterized protein
MIFKEEFYLDFPVQEAWEFFTDFPSPINVIPGAFEVKQLKPYSYTGAALVHIGPCEFCFRGNIDIIKVDTPSRQVVLRGGAADSILGGNFAATAYTQTQAVGANRTRVIVEVHVGLGGLLGKFGMFILRPKARNVVQEYAKLVSAELLRRRATDYASEPVAASA